jgi:hypothetical protein
MEFSTRSVIKAVGLLIVLVSVLITAEYTYGLAVGHYATKVFGYKVLVMCMTYLGVGMFLMLRTIITLDKLWRSNERLVLTLKGIKVVEPVKIPEAKVRS